MSRYLLYLSLLLLPLNAQAELTYEDLQRSTNTPQQFEGRFVQEKYLAALDTSLTSSGKFSFLKGEELRWHTLEPIENELVITPETITNNQNNQQLLKLESKNNPAAALIGEILFSVMTADWRRLENYFQLSGSRSENTWKATLIPTDSAVSSLMIRIDLKGGTLLQEIVLHELGGDRTTITFELASS